MKDRNIKGIVMLMFFVFFIILGIMTGRELSVGVGIGFIMASFISFIELTESISKTSEGGKE